MQKYKLLTAYKIINRLPEKFDVTYFGIDGYKGLKAIINLTRLWRKIKKYDVFLVSNPDIKIMVLCFILKIIPFCKTKIVFWDMLLVRPRDFKSKMVAYLERIFLARIDRFLVDHKDTEGYERYYKIPKYKFHYIPFKANNLSFLSELRPQDGGYVLSCGASHRDYKTFLEAIEMLGYPTKIVLPQKGVAKYHGTKLEEKQCPANVKIIRHDFNVNTWNEYLANARIVVIPIEPGTLQAAGISVYLEAMALGKPVVITEGVSTMGILRENMAEIVPGGNPTKMASSIRLLWENESYRGEISRRGREFALSLGGRDRMATDILENIASFLDATRKDRNNPL